MHYPDLGSASDWLKETFPRGTTNQKHYEDLGSARHQYGISALVTQTSLCEGSSGDLTKRRLFSQANFLVDVQGLLKPANIAPSHCSWKCSEAAVFRG